MAGVAAAGAVIDRWRAMASIHTTSSAASYLGVSEASVRRWADAGLLSVQRVGPRRARRFAEEDLRRLKASARMAGFASSGGVKPPAAARSGQFGAHDHLATFYDSDVGRLRLSLPFLRDGLLAGQRCFLVASKAVADEYVDALSRQPGLDVPAAIESGALSIRADVGSSSREATAAWERLWWEALGLGASAMRVVGEMATYEGFADVGEMLAYEMAYDSLAQRHPVVTLCQYDVRHFSGETIIGALKAHPDLFSKRIADFFA
jgi:excisionase family DNA binding protein